MWILILHCKNSILYLKCIFNLNRWRDRQYFGPKRWLETALRDPAWQVLKLKTEAHDIFFYETKAKKLEKDVIFFGNLFFRCLP
jgi:hypothetical protein